MDNYRVVRRLARPQVSVDGLRRPVGAVTQTHAQRVTPVPAAPQVAAIDSGPSLIADLSHIDIDQSVLQAARAMTAATVERPNLEAVADSPEAVREVRATPFDIALIEDREMPKNRLTARYKLRKWLIIGGASLAALVLVTGGLLLAQGYSKVHKVFRGGPTQVAALADNRAPLLRGESTGRVNVLLLGNGGDGHDAPDLTDTMLVLSVDVVHKTAILLSVPRDLWVQVPGAGSSKINAAYEIGKYDALGKIDDSNANTKAVEAGFRLADTVVKNVTGLNIDYNVLVNFTSFKQAVDAVGGVTVDVPTQLYDPTMAWENNNNPILAAAGVQTMDGSEALLYVRSRETTSDFARSLRQRSVIMALKDKVLSIGTLSSPLKVSQLINAFGDNVVTDFSLAEAMRAYGIGKDIANDKITSVDLVTPPHQLIKTAAMGTASIAEPLAGLNDYSDIKAYIQQLLAGSTTTTTSGDGSSTTITTSTTGATAAVTPSENATISVLNGTTRAGLAGTKAAALKAAGYSVGTVGNAPSTGYTQTVIVDYSSGADPNTKAYLEKAFGVTATTSAPAGVQPGGAQFVVILGSGQ